jgi:hypothetical protein
MRAIARPPARAPDRTHEAPLALIQTRGRKAVLGVWAAASRRKVRIAHHGNGNASESGPWVQVSRLGNPLFNEVIVPMT